MSDRPTRSDYVAWRTVTTRWRDDDAYGHLNNATYYELFDTAVNAHLYEATGQTDRVAVWRQRLEEFERTATNGVVPAPQPKSPP